MPFIKSVNTRLYYEDRGSGPAIVFVHEFGSDMRSWQAVVDRLHSCHRCITFNARGYPPSQVEDLPESYGLDVSVNDLQNLILQLNLQDFWIVGASMGAFVALEWALTHAGAAKGVVLSGLGTGAKLEAQQAARSRAFDLANLFESGRGEIAADMLYGAHSRRRLKQKNPEFWLDLRDQAAHFSGFGAAHSLRQHQAKRVPLVQYEARLAEHLAPILLISGDEDADCLDVNTYLKRVFPASGLWVCPQTGHLVHAEEPEAFVKAVSDFMDQVTAGRWVYTL
jgi:pimeloyl-ACP methyl ester carboxylesterase